MIWDILIAFCMQIAGTVGVIFLFGFLVACCNRTFYRNFGRRGRAVCYVTGFFGTPVHELSHALMCVIFGHRILEVKLFQVSDTDGTLGYVAHTFNRRNIYQRVGNFFIGIAPIVVITAILYLIAWLLLPAMTGEFFAAVGNVDLSEGFVSVMVCLFSAIGVFFSYAAQWQWWVFLLIGMLLSLHMTLSGADIKGAIDGLLFVAVALLLADIIMGLCSMSALSAFTGFCLGAAGYLISFFAIALIFALLAVLISLPFRLRR